MTIKKKKILLIALLLCTIDIYSQLQLPTFFGDNMVLQQQTKNAVWGNAKANEAVIVSTSWGEKVKTNADEAGKWKVFIHTPAYNINQNINIKSGDSEIVLNNVAIGEVWLCLGQSNMGWSLGNCFNWEQEVLKTDNPQLRIYKSDRQHWHEPKDDCPSGMWKVSNIASAKLTSAVSWYFGNTLQKELNIPVGIIVQAYAGTPVEGWLPWSIQKDIPRSLYHKNLLDITDEKQKQKLGYSKEKALETYRKELLIYEQRMAKGDSMKSKNKKLTLPIITKPASMGNQYPSHIFNAMVHPLLGYGIKGIIWYQGERNSKTVQQAIAFKEQLNILIDYYREIWHEHSGGNVDDDYYFSLTQLPSWGKEQELAVEGVESPWAVSRNMMFELSQKLDNVGMSVSIDTGSLVELHPKNKKPIGLRHAYGVLHDVYGLNQVGHGPYFKSCKVVGNKIEISYTGCGRGLMKGREGALNTFAIAGKDQEWKWAKANIVGDKVVVYSDEVTEPVAVRYAWAMNPSQRNLLYNKEGFPASPFRTDNWALYKEGAEEITVLKPKKDKDFKAKDWERPAINIAKP
ncbi:sialate O-acetylesterase [Labilibacter sediminis]|nr:sialate O-acetylesterase [Labilibacter sediminis]